MRVDAIYARQSIDKKDSLSIETQIEKCEYRAEKKYKVYSDKGYSGKNTLRPSLESLIRDIEDDKINRLIVYRLDRISRNITDFYNLYDIMQEHNTEFISVNENFDTSTTLGRAMMGILIVFAQMERESIQERVTDNYYSRISMDGRWAGGPAPYGFTTARTPSKVPTLAINEEEMEIVKYCFNTYAYAPNTSLNQICKKLTELGFKSRRKNGAWDSVTIARILQNSVYAVADARLKKFYELRKVKFLNDKDWDGSSSCHIVGKRKGNCNVRKYTTLEEQSVYLTNFKGIIDSKTFILVQERLAENEQLKRSNAPSILQELSGLLKCGSCGYSIKSYSKSTNGTPYLNCYGKYTLKACDKVFSRLKLSDIQNAVGVEIQKELDKISNQISEKINDSITKEIEIKELQTQMTNLINLVALGGATATTVHTQIEQIQAKINELQLNQFMNLQTTERLGAKDTLPITYNNLSIDEKKNICHQLIEKIILYDNGSLEIIWKI